MIPDNGQNQNNELSSVFTWVLRYLRVLYEVMEDGRAFHLAYYLGRASYADDMSKRKLLTPNVEFVLSTRQ